MCVVCVEWEAGKLTSKEALKNLGEMIQSEEKSKANHYFDAVSKILDKEVPVGQTDQELDEKWHEENHE